jgi:hypothetical protein
MERLTAAATNWERNGTLWEWGSCSSYPTIRHRFSRLREVMMEEVGIPSNIQTAIMDNHEPNEEGVYPDWVDKEYVSKHRELKLNVTAMRRSIGFKMGILRNHG